MNDFWKNISEIKIKKIFPRSAAPVTQVRRAQMFIKNLAFKKSNNKGLIWQDV